SDPRRPPWNCKFYFSSNSSSDPTQRTIVRLKDSKYTESRIAPTISSTSPTPKYHQPVLFPSRTKRSLPSSEKYCALPPTTATHPANRATLNTERRTRSLLALSSRVNSTYRSTTAI